MVMVLRSLSKFLENGASVSLIILTEWITPAEYSVFFNALGSSERIPFLRNHEKYPKWILKFLLVSETIRVFDLWEAIDRGRLVDFTVFEDKILHINSRMLSIRFDPSSVAMENFLVCISHFEKIKINVAFLNRNFPMIIIDHISARIHSLNLTGAVSRQPMFYLRLLGNLDTLTIECINRNELLAVVVNARQVSKLAVNGPRLKSADLVLFGFHCPSVTSFNATACGYTDLGLRTFLSCKGAKLKALSLDRALLLTELSTIGLQGTCSQLTSLSFSLCDKLNRAAVCHWCDHCPRLESLSLSDNKGISAVVWLNIYQRCSLLKRLQLCRLKASPLWAEWEIVCCSLTSLDLNGLRILDPVLVCILSEEATRHLVYLDLGHNKGLTTFGLLEVVPRLRSLKTLNLEYCSGTTDNVAFCVAQNCPDLVCVNLDGCFCVTDEGLLVLLKVCSKLTSLSAQYLGKCAVSPILDCVVNNQLQIRRLLITTDSDEEKYPELEKRMREYRPTMEVYIRTGRVENRPTVGISGSNSSNGGGSAENWIVAVPTIEKSDEDDPRADI